MKMLYQSKGKRGKPIKRFLGALQLPSHALPLGLVEIFKITVAYSATNDKLIGN